MQPQGARHRLVSSSGGMTSFRGVCGDERPEELRRHETRMVKIGEAKTLETPATAIARAKVEQEKYLSNHVSAGQHPCTFRKARRGHTGTNLRVWSLNLVPRAGLEPAPSVLSRNI